VATRNFYINTPSNFGADGGVGTTETAPGSSGNRNEGWTVAKTASGRYSNMAANTKRASGTFTTTLVPTALDNTLKNWIEIDPGGAGQFAAGDWTVMLRFRGVTISSQAGRGRYRIFKGTSPATATEITAAVHLGTTITLSATVYNLSNATITLGAITVAAGEKIYVAVAWEITTASGNNSGDVMLTNNTNNTFIQTTNWTQPATVALGVCSFGFSPQDVNLPVARKIKLEGAETTNYARYSEELDVAATWRKGGTASVTANTANDSTGAATLDSVSFPGGGDYIELHSSDNAHLLGLAGKTVTFSMEMVDGGSRDITIYDDVNGFRTIQVTPTGSPVRYSHTAQIAAGATVVSFRVGFFAAGVAGTVKMGRVLINEGSSVGTYSKTTTANVTCPLFSMSAKPVTLTPGAAPKTLVAGMASYSESAQAVTFRIGRKVSAAVSAYSEAAQDVRLLHGRKLVAGHAAFAESAQALNLRVGKKIITANVSFAFNPQAITFIPAAIARLEADVLAFAPQPVILRSTRRLITANASFAFSPQSANVARGLKLVAGHAAFGLSPQNVNLLRRLKLVTGVSSYAESPQPIVFRKSFTVSVAAASFAESAQPVNFRRALRIIAGVSSYAESPQPLNLRRSLKLIAANAAFGFSPQAVLLERSLRISIAAASFAESAQAVTLSVAGALAIDSAAFAFAPQSVNLRRAARIILAHAAFAESAQAVTLSVAGALPIDAASFGFAPQEVDFIYAPLASYELQVEAASFAFAPQSVNLLRRLRVPLGVNAMSFNAQDVRLLRALKLIAAPAAFAFAPQQVNFPTAKAVSLDAGAFASSAQNVTLRTARTLRMDGAAFAFAPRELSLLRRLTVRPEAALFSFSPRDLTFVYERVLVLAPASFAFGPQAVGLALYEVVIGPFRGEVLSGSKYQGAFLSLSPFRGEFISSNLYHGISMSKNT
jgi:hypothetical protein